MTVKLNKKYSNQIKIRIFLNLFIQTHAVTIYFGFFIFPHPICSLSMFFSPFLQRKTRSFVYKTYSFSEYMFSSSHLL